ncbi:MAG: cupredoxin domain-containing protein [Actinobacteria bacterium]|nr:cupredoxin domain-containing protein [Actinomycetota bacterium]MBV8480663.1 cupredoxin domain-containing protein [Actinomycetota bacterium]
MRLPVRAAAVAASAMALGGLATPALAAHSHASATSVKVVAVEFKFTLTPSAVSTPGPVTFTLVNKGHVAHDFKIAGKTTALIQPGKSTKLTVTLKAGKYPYLCTVPGHAAAGMKGTLTVK